MRLAPSRVCKPVVAFGLQPIAEPSNVPRREPQRLSGLGLCELLRKDWANHMDPPPFAPTHDDSVLSDPPALLVRVGSL